MKYRTIVADPPWNYGKTTPAYGMSLLGRKGSRARVPTPYPTLTLEEIKSLPIKQLAAPDAHLYLWTTNTHLRHAWDVCEAWGFRYSTPLVWCKAPRGSVGNPAFRGCTEFVMFARRGTLGCKQRIDRNWWTWPLSNTHSRKPDAFLDLVEQVSPGPYVELFARRARFGWDYWGDESLSTVEMPA